MDPNEGAQAAWLADWLPWIETARMMGLPVDATLGDRAGTAAAARR
jgi:hypothetical protein